MDKKFIRIKILLKFLEVVSVFIPIFFAREILTSVQNGDDARDVILLAGAFAGITFLGRLLKDLFLRMDEREQDHIYRLVRKDIAGLVQKMPFYEVEKAETRDFIQLVKNTVDISELLNSIFNFFQEFVTLCGLAAVVVTLHPLFLLLLVAVLAVRMSANRGVRHLWEIWRETVNSVFRKVNYVISIMGDAGYGKEIRINGLQQWFRKKAEDSIGEYTKAMRRYNTALQKKNALVEGAALVQEGAVYLWLAYEVVCRQMTIGDFSMYLSSITRLSQTLSSIADTFSALLQEGEFLGEYRKLAERFSEGNIEAWSGCEMEPDKGMALSFEHVSFCYPGSDRLILDDISFTLKTNQSLSIVGVNGAGKTTIVKLICRFYKPVKGKILINGVDIALIDEEVYKKLLGVVFQDYKLFAFTLSENVALKSSCDEARLLDALRKADLAEKTASLEQGARTVISKQFDDCGIELSGGESQRLELARILYKDPCIAIFDEPAASLDPITEYHMYQAMHEMTQDKLSIFISHRLASTKFTDSILVLQDGRVAEYGNFEELMKNKNSIFYCMYAMQQEHYII